MDKRKRRARARKKAKLNEAERQQVAAARAADRERFNKLFEEKARALNIENWSKKDDTNN